MPKNARVTASSGSEQQRRPAEVEEEGKDRMENDGAGVVPENQPQQKLVLRNDLALDSDAEV